MPFTLLENPANPPFQRFLAAHEPYSLRIIGVLAEGADNPSIWVDDVENPSLAVHRARGWLASLCDTSIIVARLADLEAMAAEMEKAGEAPYHPGSQEEKNVLRLSALPATARDIIAERRDILRQTPCGLYTLMRENFTPYTDGPPIGQIREEEHEMVADLAQHGEGVSYVKSRLSKAPHTAVRVDGELAAYMLVHANGSIGMLHTVERFRNRGLGRLVASALAERQFARGMAVYCYILDENTPSHRVFTSLGFRRVADVVWCVFRRGDR